ncbi:MAG TPA: GNAT family N-acetyltransferase [Xanthomonadales bacterium]|nr:GNAT family N-acetyltransferase [Xanthomonadales bacterium]
MSSPATLSLTVRNGVADIPAADWDALIGADDQPFVRHAFLSALEQSGSLQRELGWSPMPLLLHQGGQLIAAAPGYLKTNSHGEFVFDWSWADAYRRNGLVYYPKLLIGVPYSPITGPRLLVGAGVDAGERRAKLVGAIESLVGQLRLSSAHLNFLDESDAAALVHDPWLPRFDWQFHFHNRGYADFEALLSEFSHKKRKNIRQERRHAQSCGLDIEWLDGEAMSEATLDDLHALYVETFDRKGNTPALTREFFSLIRERLPGSFHAAVARRGARIVAAAIYFSSSTTLYGRYWGAREDLPGMHFELCYYQAIEQVLRRGLKCCEPGAQGEHKIARGFLPTRTRSAHLIVHPQFRQAIRHAIDDEAQALREYREQLQAHSPFRHSEQ